MQLAIFVPVDKGVHLMDGAEIIPLNLTRIMPPEELLTSLSIACPPIVCIINER